MKLLFFAQYYWELHWFHNLIEALDADVYTTDDVCKEYCARYNFKLTDTRTDYQVVALTGMHFGQHWDMVQYFKNTGGFVLLFQHAWDSALNLKQDFWNKDMGSFDRYYVGCEQDAEWLTHMYGKERVVYTGMPKLDDLHKVWRSRKRYKDLYEELGVDNFVLSIAPSESISRDVMHKYDKELEAACPYPVVFKIHPGGDHIGTIQHHKETGRNIRLVDDDIFDRFRTYELIKASLATVCVESFMSIETSLLRRPVVFWGYDALPEDWFGRDYNVNQIQRAPIEMASSFEDLRYTDVQKNIASKYLFDGKNTERTAVAVKEFLNDKA